MKLTSWGNDPEEKEPSRNFPLRSQIAGVCETCDVHQKGSKAHAHYLMGPQNLSEQSRFYCLTKMIQFDGIAVYRLNGT